MLLIASGKPQRTILGEASTKLDRLVREMLTEPPVGERLGAVSNK
jgi:hypothetical protein